MYKFNTLFALRYLACLSVMCCGYWGMIKYFTESLYWLGFFIFMIGVFFALNVGDDMS